MSNGVDRNDSEGTIQLRWLGKGDAAQKKHGSKGMTREEAITLPSSDEEVELIEESRCKWKGKEKEGNQAVAIARRPPFRPEKHSQRKFTKSPSKGSTRSSGALSTTPLPDISYLLDLRLGTLPSPARQPVASSSRAILPSTQAGWRRKGPVCKKEIRSATRDLTHSPMKKPPCTPTKPNLFGREGTSSSSVILVDATPERRYRTRRQPMGKGTANEPYELLDDADSPPTRNIPLPSQQDDSEIPSTQGPKPTTANTVATPRESTGHATQPVKLLASQESAKPKAQRGAFGGHKMTPSTQIAMSRKGSEVSIGSNQSSQRPLTPSKRAYAITDRVRAASSFRQTSNTSDRPRRARPENGAYRIPGLDDVEWPTTQASNLNPPRKTALQKTPQAEDQHDRPLAKVIPTPTRRQQSQTDISRKATSPLTPLAESMVLPSPLRTVGSKRAQMLVAEEGQREMEDSVTASGILQVQEDSEDDSSDDDLLAEFAEYDYQPPQSPTAATRDPHTPSKLLTTTPRSAPAHFTPSLLFTDSTAVTPSKRRRSDTSETPRKVAPRRQSPSEFDRILEEERRVKVEAAHRAREDRERQHQANLARLDEGDEDDDEMDTAEDLMRKAAEEAQMRQEKAAAKAAAREKALELAREKDQAAFKPELSSDMKALVRVSKKSARKSGTKLDSVLAEIRREQNGLQQSVPYPTPISEPDEDSDMDVDEDDLLDEVEQMDGVSGVVDSKLLDNLRAGRQTKDADWSGVWDGPEQPVAKREGDIPLPELDLDAVSSGHHLQRALQRRSLRLLTSALTSGIFDTVLDNADNAKSVYAYLVSEALASEASRAEKAAHLLNRLLSTAVDRPEWSSALFAVLYNAWKALGMAQAILGAEAEEVAVQVQCDRETANLYLISFVGSCASGLKWAAAEALRLAVILVHLYADSSSSQMMRDAIASAMPSLWDCIVPQHTPIHIARGLCLRSAGLPPSAQYKMWQSVGSRSTKSREVSQWFALALVAGVGILDTVKVKREPTLPSFDLVFQAAEAIHDHLTDRMVTHDHNKVFHWLSYFAELTGDMSSVIASFMSLKDASTELTAMRSCLKTAESKIVVRSYNKSKERFNKSRMQQMDISLEKLGGIAIRRREREETERKKGMRRGEKGQMKLAFARRETDAGSEA